MRWPATNASVEATDAASGTDAMVAAAPAAAAAGTSAAAARSFGFVEAASSAGARYRSMTDAAPSTYSPE
jgi:hypothetical protein